MNMHANQIDWVKRLFSTSLIERMMLRHVVELVGLTSGETCLLVNGNGPGLALMLCEVSGRWHSVHTDKDVAELLQIRDRERSEVKPAGPLSFKDKTFDAVVVVDYLERQADPYTHVEEFHRVLKDSGRLVLLLPQGKRMGLARGLQKVLGLTSGQELEGVEVYTSTRLFETVKNGFDLEEERSFSRFNLEMTESIIRFIAEYSASRMARKLEASVTNKALNERAIADRVYRVRAVCYPLLFLANALDGLLFFTSGYRLVGRGRRRIWRDRAAPVLTDGRSLADATINTKIGTAGPF